MNFERIQLLLNVVHATLDVPGTGKIRDAALKELMDHNAGTWVDPNPDPELPLNMDKRL